MNFAMWQKEQHVSLLEQRRSRKATTVVMQLRCAVAHVKTYTLVISDTPPLNTAEFVVAAVTAHKAHRNHLACSSTAVVTWLEYRPAPLEASFSLCNTTNTATTIIAARRSIWLVTHTHTLGYTVVSCG
jgi:hypothetical protein